ncbi:MAG: DUF3160 domain-containing protein [Myxococcota bacterium]
MKRRLALVLLAACTTKPPATPPDPPAVSTPAPPAVAAETPAAAGAKWTAILPDGATTRDVEALRFAERVPGLSGEHRRHLRAHGFFITPQGQPAPDTKDPAKARASRRAKHLFQVYERNDYIRFPSYVTVDLAIDLTHQYFDVVLRKLERDILVPKLALALRGFTAEAVRMRDAAKTPAAKKAAPAAATYWGTALRLLEEPAPGDAPDIVVARAPWYDYPEARAEMGDHEGPAPKQPKPKLTKLDRASAREIKAAVKAVHAAAGRKKFAPWGQTLDLTLARPRSHYAGSGVLQRYFRAMSLLGLSSFAIEGEDARPELLAALAMSLGRATKAREAYDDVLRLTNFVVGEPPTSGLPRANSAIETIAKGSDLDAVLKPQTLAKVVYLWGAFKAHPVAGGGPVVQPIGQRVFVDTLAMSKMLPLVRELPDTRRDLVARAMGPAGAAAVLGSDDARAVVLELAGDEHDSLTAALTEGAALLAKQPARDDAYHGTLRALTHLLDADPLMFDPAAHRRRMLQSFAGGWALLRHDTLLYAYQMGAECDAEELTSPYAWVEPYPEVYGELRTMVTDFSKRLRSAGVTMKSRDDEWEEGKYSIATKTDALVGFLDQMIRWSNKELAGEAFTPEERTDVAMVGGRAEHVVLTLADAFELGAGNDDMAVVADVFTFRGQALEVAVGHPELIYAVIPTPEGWALARGAVMAYREFFVPTAKRMTDETWKEQVGKSADFELSSRPAWLSNTLAPEVGVIELPSDGKGQDRCEYNGGIYEL